MKRIISALVCAVTVLSLCSCTAKREKLPTNYDELTDKLSQTVEALFETDFEEKLEAGEYRCPTGEQSENWNSMLRDAKAELPNVDKKHFGYKIIDINSDSIPELFFMRSDGTVLAIFNIDEGRPRLLECFNGTYRCVVMDSGELYTVNTREDGVEYKISTLLPAGGLAVTVSFGTEGETCYELVGGEKDSVTAERITELCAIYPFESSEIFTELQLYMF